MTMGNKNAVKGLAFLLCGVSLALAWANLTEFRQIPGIADRLPTWDAAAHGVDGIFLTDALRNFQPTELFRTLHHMAYWPPMFPIFEIPSFAFFGYDYIVPRTMMAGLFLGTVFAAFWAGFGLGTGGGLAALVVAVLMASSPYFLHHSHFVMLEIPVTLLQMVSLGIYLRLLRNGAKGASLYRWLWLTTTMMFFTKYNYGLIWLLFVAVHLLIIRRKDRLGLWAFAVGYWNRREWRRPFDAFVWIALSAIVLLFLSGGFTTEVMGRTVSVTTVATPLYVLYLIVLGRFFAMPSGRTLVWETYYRLPLPWQSLVRWTLLPIGLWFLHPLFLRTFLTFIQNENKGADFFYSVEYYFAAFHEKFVDQPTLAVALLALCMIPLLAWKKAPQTVRVTYAFLIFSTFLCLSHPNRGPRYIFPYVPLVWMLAGWSITWILSHIPKPVIRQTATASFAVLIVGLGWHLRPPLERMSEDFFSSTMPPELSEVADAVCMRSDEVSRSALVGFWWGFSPSMLQWHCRLAKHASYLDPKKIPTTLRRMGASHGSDQSKWKEFLNQPEMQQIFVITHQGDSPYLKDFERELKPYLPMLQVLDGENHWVPTENLAFRGTHHRLTVYRRSH